MKEIQHRPKGAILACERCGDPEAGVQPPDRQSFNAAPCGSRRRDGNCVR